MGPLHFLMLTGGFAEPPAQKPQHFWDSPRSLSERIFDRSMPKVAAGCFSAVCFYCSLPCCPESYCVSQPWCDVCTSCLSRPVTFYGVFLGAATISVLLLSRRELHPGLKPAGTSLCRLMLCIWGKLPGHQYFCRRTRGKEATVCPKLLKRAFL